jgi:hypothetical protein
MAILFVSTVSCVAIWRHWHSHVLIVEVSAKVQKTLTALGADIDLRLALRDALNERITGVEQIVALQGLPYAGDTDSSNAVSFAPFGVNVSTDTITQIVDHIFGRPPRPTVRLEIRCAPRACDDPEVRNATLVMNLSTPSGSRTASYPVVLGNRGLTRSVQQSVENIADLMLEQSDPVIASVLFLNRYAATVFNDQYRPDLIRAEGAAVAGRKPDDAGCIADLVIGGSLTERGEFAAGIAAEQRAAQASNVVCKIHGDSNIVFMLAGFALCAKDEAAREYADLQVTQASQRLEKLAIPRYSSVDDVAYYRIPASSLITAMMHALETAGPSQQPACITSPAPQSVPGSTMAKQLRTLLAAAQPRLLPPDKPTLMRYRTPTVVQHQVLSDFWLAMRAGVPRDELADRLTLDRELMKVIRRTELNDPHPRALFILEGNVAMEMSRAALESLGPKVDDSARVQLASELEPDDVYAESHPSMKLIFSAYHNLSAATVAFENASGTTGSARLVEPTISEVEMLRQLGDARYASGNPASALTAYAHAVDKFIESSEPVDEVPPLTDALIRWANILIEQGCGTDQHPDPVWVEKWNRLGDTPPNVCRLTKPGDSTEKPLLPTIQKMIRLSLTGCKVSAVAPDAEEDWTDWVAGSTRRLKMLECLDQEVADNQKPWPPAETVDGEIRQALAGRYEL